MNKLISWVLGNLDKIANAAACVVVAIVLSVIFLHTTAGITVVAAAGCGFFGSLFISAVIAIWRFFIKEDFNGSNFIASAFGAILGFLITLLVL